MGRGEGGFPPHSAMKGGGGLRLPSMILVRTQFDLLRGYFLKCALALLLFFLCLIYDITSKNKKDFKIWFDRKGAIKIREIEGFILVYGS